MIPRRVVLALPLVLGVAGCRTDGLFAGPDPLGSQPPLAKDTEALQYMIAAESGLVALYRSVSAHADGGTGHAALLGALLGEHEQHLAQLRAWLVVPAGSSSPPSASGAAVAPAPVVSPGKRPLDQLRVAEQQSSLTYLEYLTGRPPALAQLFASIAASEFSHANALTQAGAR
jgi:hypothetical protein